MTPIDPSEPIAIVGLGGLFPKALDINAFWENIKARKDCVVETPKSRWDWKIYYDPNPAAPDKTYSKIGGFVEGFKFDPLKLRIPPPVAAQMDTVQHLAVTATGEALRDSGYDKKPFNAERTAVILGNAMGGPKKELTDLRVYSAYYMDRLQQTAAFGKLPAAAKSALVAEAAAFTKADLSTITEDTMPGELSNVIAGRVANAFNFNGTNITVDAACASSLAALSQAMHALRLRECDMAISGGVDQMMSAPSYVKFCKIGALSPDGSRPFDAQANGFVMGEGTGIMVLKRLSDARKAGDRIYALIRAVGSSSDGRGKGITAPNPKGQRLAIERCFAALNYGPEGVDLLEAHGTSTKVGDVVEINAAAEVFAKGAKKGSIGLGSIKSQIGHLKAAAGAAAAVKATLALYHKVLPPTINFKTPNPGIDWANSPFRVLTQAEEWNRSGHPRRAHVSSFGFGGTNFHVAFEEAEPDTVSRVPDWTLVESAKHGPRGGGDGASLPGAGSALPEAGEDVDPGLGGEAFLLHGSTPEACFEKLKALSEKVTGGPLTAAAWSVNHGAKRSEFSLCLAAESAAKLREKAELILRTKEAAIFDKPAGPLYKTKSIYARRTKKPGKIGFMFPGQGSQYVDMMKDLRDKYQVVQDTFDEADRIMQKLIGEKLSDRVFTKGGETPDRVAAMEHRIKQTEITQPAVLTAGIAVLRLLKTYGIEPDVVLGHSLGEYGAHVAAGILSFEDALLAVSARGKEMASVKVADCGKMASIAASVEKVEPVLKTIKGYVSIANKNCPIQTVIAGETKAVEAAVKKFSLMGIQAVEIQVSHAFHSTIVQPAQDAYGRFLDGLQMKKPSVPILSNVTAAYYPEDVREIRKLLVLQIAEPVEFIRQIERMYKDGVRIFIEVGPKRALTAFTTSILEGKPDAVALSSNHPKRGGIMELNDLLARISSEGVDIKLEGKDPSKDGFYTPRYSAHVRRNTATAVEQAAPSAQPATSVTQSGPVPTSSEGWDLWTGPVVISGVSAGLPGTAERLFRENGLDQIIHGQNLIEALPEDELYKQLEKNLDRVKKSETGAHAIERLVSVDQVMRLAGRAGTFDIAEEFGIRASVNSLMDVTAKMGLAAALLALKDAGIPLVHHYKRTTTGSMIPTSWTLPESLQEGTGVILASAFPGIDSLIQDLTSYFRSKYQGKTAKAAYAVYDRVMQSIKDPAERQALTDWYVQQRQELEKGGPAAEYKFSRSFLFRILCLGHGQAAQFLRAKGPVTQINAACASTTQAVGIAEDWIRLGRCKRVVVMGVDDVTNPVMLEWVGTGFLASGASSTHNVVSEAALPFDRRRNGMIVGMGSVGLILEDGRETAARGMKPLAELLATQFDNSAFHVTRLDTKHVSETMERLVRKAERRHGLTRKQIAQKMLFMSHETYTPAQGGSSAAEVEALKHVFKEDTGKLVVTNTKGFTGHAMGASIEDAVAVRAMNTGQVPPIANYKEPDPELTGITLSKGGAYDCEFALRLAAGFGSQVAMTLMRRAWKAGEPRVFDEGRHQGWLRDVTGEAAPELEVTYNTLRVKDTGAKRNRAAQARVPARPARAVSPAPVSPEPAPQARAATAVAPPPLNLTRDIVQLVSEKTGYPPEMLELDLDMEADLGIDTVKQAELIGIVREKYGIPKQENLSLKDYPTLRHVIDFVKKGATTQLPAVDPVADKPAPGAPDAKLTRDIVQLVSEKTGYPPEMLELDLDMEADLGIDTVKQAELIGIIREKYGIPKQENLSLKDYPTLRHVIDFVKKGATAQLPAVDPVADKPAPGAPDAKLTRDIVQLVSEKTGYPPEMLELDLDMEADLGIDTVKQAELIGIIREKYGIPKQENLSLKDYPTLRSVIGFVTAGGKPKSDESAPAVTNAAPPPEASVTASAEANAASEAPVLSDGRFAPWRVEAYPRAAKCLPPALPKDRLVVVLALDLKTAQPFVAAVENAGGHAVAVKTAAWPTAAEAAADVRKAMKDQRAVGIIDVTTLDLPEFDTIAPADFDGHYQRTARALFLTAQCLREDLVEAGEKAALLTVTRMGGAHGVQATRPLQPFSGAVTGLSKALSRELDRARTCAIDFEPGLPLTEMAALALGELGSKDPRREVGYRDGVRHALRVVRYHREKTTARPVGDDSVFLITGGGGALAAVLSKDIARRWKSRIVLLDLLGLPDEAGTWAALSEDELKALKARMWEDLKKDTSRKATPVMLEREFGRVRYSIRVHRQLDELARMGSEVLYVAGNLVDAEQTARAVRQAISEFGRIDFVIHTAGLEESKLLGDKKVEQYDRVVRPKAHGAYHLAKAIPPSEGQRWAFFSSVVARFGNIGQTDYATANDFLVKLAARLNAQGRSAVAFDLTAFAEVGMATRGGVHDFLESMGVDFMPPKIGLGMLLDELANGGAETELVLTGALGKLDSDRLLEEGPAAQPADKTRLVTEKTFSVEGDPWLEDHSIAGTPYVAGVMGLELLANAASKLSGGAPAGFEDVRFALPIKLLRHKPVHVKVKAAPHDGDTDLTIETEFVSPKGARLGEPKVHFAGRTCKHAAPKWEHPKPEIKAGAFAVGAKEVYSKYFHGPSFQVIEGLLQLSEKESLAVYKRPAKALWPKDAPKLLFLPMLIEAAFQACGFRDLQYGKRMTLPDSIGRVQVQRHDDAEPERLYVYTVYKGSEGDNKSVYDAYVFDEKHRIWAQLTDYRMIAVS